MHQHPTATQGDRRSPEDGFGGGGGRGGGQGAWLATRRRSFHHRPPSHLSWPPSRRCRETWGQGAGSAGARTPHRRAPIPSSLLSPRPLAQHRRRPRLDVRRGAHGEEDDGEESVEVKEGGHGGAGCAVVAVAARCAAGRGEGAGRGAGSPEQCAQPTRRRRPSLPVLSPANQAAARSDVLRDKGGYV